MPKNLNPHLTKDGWRAVREQLTQGSQVAEAKTYLQKISDNIRIFFTDGEGFGDQMFVVNIIDQLRQLGYQGTIEVIGHFRELSSGLAPTYKSALRNMLKLYDAEHLFNHEVGFLYFKTLDGSIIHFYDYDYFKKNQHSLPEVELALFPGLLGRFYYNYYNAPFISFYLTSSWFDVLDHMTSIAKSKRAIFLNFYTALHFQHDAGLGVSIQVKGKESKVDFHSHSLGYPVSPKPTSIIKNELLKLKEKQPVLGHNIEHLLKLKQENHVDTFSIYAVHHFSKPENPLMNLLLGSQLAHAGREKPLLIFVMSPISDSSWKNLQDMCQQGKTAGFMPLQAGPCLNNTFFFELQKENDLLERYQTKAVCVLRFPSIPWILFNALFNSTYPPVYEGVNSAMQLYYSKQPRNGLPCPKPVDSDTRRRARFPVANQPELPDSLALAGEQICPLHIKPEREPYLPTKHQRNKARKVIYPSHYYVAFFMAKYAKHPLPPGLPPSLPYVDPHNLTLWFNKTEELLPPQSGNDRLAYALALVSHEAEPDYESSYESAKGEKIQISYDWNMPIRTGLKGFSYGFLEHSLMSGFKIMGLSEPQAHRLARNMEFGLKGVLDNQVISACSLMAMDTILDFTSISPKNKKQAQMALVALLFMCEWLPQLFESDNQERSFISQMLCLSFLSWFTHTLGRQASQAIWQKMGFFSPPAAQQHPSRVASSPAVELPDVRTQAKPSASIKHD